jgi:hypothetical protein
VGTTANVAGAVTLGGVATFSAQPIFSSLTASTAVATDASKGLVSVTNTGTGNNVLGTGPTISLPVIDNIKMGYTTTATAAGTTTLTVASNYRQFFTGSTTQTVVLPVTSTLMTGISYEIENNSTGLLTVNSSGGNLVGTIPTGVCAHAVCIGTTLTTAADWDWDYISNSAITGTGAAVLATSPTLVTPILGAASATSITVAAGAAGTPSITTTGDTNTGIFFPAADTIAFTEGGTEAARIDSSGNLLVAQTATSQTTIGASMQSSGQVYSCLAASTNVATSYLIYSTGAGAYRFYVQMDGKINATSTTIAAISDIRLKENVRDLDFGLSEIMSLKPRRFDWKENKGMNIKDAVGFIAQEFETVFPASVSTSLAGEDGIEYKNICHEELIPTFVKAIQEQQALITDLTTRITTLENK